jgi:hypothetical protein
MSPITRGSLLPASGRTIRLVRHHGRPGVANIGCCRGAGDTGLAWWWATRVRGCLGAGDAGLAWWWTTRVRGCLGAGDAGLARWWTGAIRRLDAKRAHGRRAGRRAGIADGFDRRRWMVLVVFAVVSVRRGGGHRAKQHRFREPTAGPGGNTREQQGSDHKANSSRAHRHAVYGLTHRRRHLRVCSRQVRRGSCPSAATRVGTRKCGARRGCRGRRCRWSRSGHRP